MKQIFSILCLMGAVSAPVAAQTDDAQQAKNDSAAVLATQIPLREVKGKVFDSSTRQPAAGIRISAYNDSKYAAMTDDNGEFTIKVPTFVTSLYFVGDGYTRVQAAVAPKGKDMTVWMSDALFGDFYTRHTKATTDHSMLVDYNTNEVSIDPQIQMQLGADMRTITRNGVAGEGVAMFMNGLNSLNANAQPLVVVDGVIFDMQYQRPSLHDGYFNNILSNLMVEDIERVTVLKNGTAIYGAKGANGVLLIETKRNKSMATKIDVSIGGSYELLPKKVDVMNAEQYRVYASELIGTTGSVSNSYKFLNTDPNYYYYRMYHNNTDWQEEAYDQAFTQNYSINVQGGDEVANYNLSVGYAQADATLKNTSYSRFNMRLNSDIMLMDNLSVRFDASYSDVTRDMRDDGAPAAIDDDVISSPSFLACIKSPFLSPYAFDAMGNPSSYLAGADDYLSDVTLGSHVNKSLANPLSIYHYGDGDNKNYFGNRLITLAVTPKWQINRYWSIAEHFAFQLVNTDENYYLPTNGVPSYEVAGIGTVQNRVSALAAREISMSSHTSFNFERRRGQHWIAAQGGLRYYKNSYKLNTQTGYNSGNDKTPNMSNSLSYKSTDGAQDEEVDMNYYLRGSYNYRERYYLDAALSMNGNSKFGRDAKGSVKIGNYSWGFFPSVEAGWVLTNERWMHIKGIDYLKLNVGFDMVGNDDVDSKASRTYFIAQKVGMDNLSGLSLGNIGNTRLGWETTTRWTAGLALSAIRNKLDVRFNFFHSNTRDLLNLSALSYLTGLDNNYANSGKLKNTGLDVTVNAKVLELKDWKWSVGASLGHYKNEITSLPSYQDGRFVSELYGAQILSQEGSAAGLFYGFKTDGVFATAAEAQAAGLYRIDEAGDRVYFGAGDMKFVDTDHNGEINDADRVVIGDPNPDIYGNIFTRLAWKRLTLDVVFNYSLGNDVYNYKRSLLESGSRFNNQTTAMLARWTHEGQHTDIPAIGYGDPMGNSRFSDRWIEDGSYLKLKNITLSYYIPIRNTYLQGITVWGAANNLFTATKYLGNDPETAVSNSVLSQGIDSGLHPLCRNFALGVKINL